jgi:acyl-CoA thioester hydrolase
LWLARETEIEYLQPLFYGDTVHIKTWVGDFRRVRSRRFYEFRRADELVAQASTDWVYLDASTLHPSAVPQEMIDAFAPDGDVELAPRREKFPDAPHPPPGMFTMRLHPQWRDIDTVQHVNNAAYLDYIADLNIEATKTHGWTATRMAEAGFTLVARSYRIEYLQPALFDDELELATWISDVAESSAIRHYTVKRARDGELLTRVRSLWFCVDSATSAPTPFPPAFLHDFASNIVGTRDEEEKA